MRANLAALSFSIFVGAAVCSAQTGPDATAPAGPQPDYSSVYCSGFISDPKVPTDTQIISAEQSNYKIIFARGDYVHINRGEDKGVKVGDRYTIVRPEKDEANEWFKGQPKASKEAGTIYRDGGQIRIVNVQPKVSVAEITFSCGGYMQRGDLARPFEERPVPPYKSAAAFDHFAPVSGKPVGTVVSSADYWQLMGKGNIAYVNIGAGKGVKVGDYMRAFRYQGTTAEYAVITKGDQYKIYGFGSAPTRYEPKDLPREILGEGIVLNVSRNSATVLLTYDTAEIYAGDFVEVE
jgi:hypothetical protein